VSPRPYQLGARQIQIDESRQRIVNAARGLLAESTTYTAFTVEAVAKRADVARATIYYQFQSKSGMLEALCDTLAVEGKLSSLGQAFAEDDSIRALHRFIEAFARFWGVDRLVMRRLRALSHLDAEVRTVIESRDDRRREGIRALLSRLALQSDFGSAVSSEEMVRGLFTLTSFETFDSLAGDGQSLEDVASVVFELAEFMLHR
jgi:AcrR family transcriptional regulator